MRQAGYEIDETDPRPGGKTIFRRAEGIYGEGDDISYEKSGGGPIRPGEMVGRVAPFERSTRTTEPPSPITPEAINAPRTPDELEAFARIQRNKEIELRNEGNIEGADHAKVS